MNPNCDVNMDSSDSSGSDDDYIEEPYVDTSLVGICLFCDHKEIDCDGLLSHMSSVHSIDLKELCKTNQLDSILYIKLVNFIRANKIDPSKLNDVITKDDWKSDDCMRPVIQNDLLLTLDVEDEDDEEEDLSPKRNNKPLKTGTDICQKETMLQREIDRVRSLIEDISSDDQGTFSHQDLINEEYSWSYSHHSIHLEMLSDRIRTEAYRDAISAIKEKLVGKSCLDIGCGTGILSLFCVSAGAGKVVAVDQSDIIYRAMDIAQENGVAERIDFKKGKLEELELDSKFDMIVSEWMGYFLLFEGMIDTVIKARDKYLRPDGLVLPGSCSMFISALSDEKLYQETIKFWDNVYGFKMTTMRNDVLGEVLVREITTEAIVSEKSLLKTFDLTTCTLEEAQKVDSSFELKITKDATIYALVAWFDCYFGTNPTIILSTAPTPTLGPNSGATHWKQSILFLEDPIQVKQDSILKGRIIISRTHDDFRSLRIRLSLAGRPVQRFTMV